MTHPTPEVLLDLALDTLPDGEVDSVRAHLAECAACAEAFGRLEDEQSVLGKALVATATPPALGVKIRASVGREPTPKPRLRRVLIAAAALLAAAAAWYATTPPRADPAVIKQAMIDQVLDSERMALGLEGGN